MEKENGIYRFAVYHEGRRIGVRETMEQAHRLADEHAVSIKRPAVNPSDLFGAESYTIRMIRTPKGQKKSETVATEIYTTRIVMRR